MNSRRNFLALLSGLALTGKGIAKAQDTIWFNQEQQNSIFRNALLQEGEGTVIYPKALQEGSVIAITAPASPASMGEISYAVKVFKNLGCSVEIGDTLTKNKNEYRYLSAPDEERAEEFMRFIERDDIDCILCARGGYGVMRILPLLDFSIIRKHPKIIIGFSDITGLVNPIFSISKIVSFHGPVAISSFDNATINNIIKTLFYKEEFEPIKYTYPGLEVLNDGAAHGKLVGGNLSLVVSTLGTPYEIDTKDKILFLEEVSEEPYKIDRMLTQLWLADKLQQSSGIAFGYFQNLDTKKHFFPNWSFTVRQVIESRIIPLGKPSYLGLPVGHIKNNLTLPIGANVEIDTKAKTFTILESPVKI